ncbi:beta strand repeat-containing protein [Archangium lansingense]|uniref:Ig-like domain-containing protein n=1 Tax=Archangium lansingense TaxID=2995310 RepID=A0ABT4A5K7_9BACT|nr:hypothetical protein [Archangium lansinium]MCY1076656.1 hypothetical protein [Archangium lansinium]
MSLEPATVALTTGGTQRFTATVTGASNASVSWTATGGEITPDGVYTAPGTAGTYSVRATSVANTNKYAESSVTVTESPVLPPPMITLFSAVPSTINPGEGTTLSWEATGATSLSIEPGVGAVTGTSVSVSPSATTTYTLTATNEAGSVTATAMVTVRQPPAITYFAATPSTINAGQSTTLNWEVAGGASLSIDQGVGAVSGGAGMPVSPSATTTYTLTATNEAGSVTATATVTVNQPPAISSFTATPATINAGQSTTLSWEATGATSLSIEPGVGTVTGTSVSVSPAVTTTYTLTATNEVGSVTATVTVTVNQPPTISSFTASSSTINAGQSTTLSWATTGATSLSISPGVGTVTGTNATVSPAVTTIYTLTAMNEVGSVTATVTVTVNQPPTISSFTASSSTINAGQSTMLSWDATGATSLRISPGVGTVTGTSVSVSPAATTTYTLTATNEVGSVTAMVTVTVNQPPTISSFTAASSTINAGQSTTLSWAATRATSLSISPGVGAVTGTSVSVRPAATTTYTLTATNEVGSFTATVTVTVNQPPTISSFTATPATINAGQSTTLRWATTGATSLSISPGVGAVTGTSVSVSPAVTTTYTLTATNAAGSVTATVTVTVNQPPTISSFTATPSMINAGQSTTLSWATTGATSLSISPGVGTVTGTSVTVSPATTTTYTLTATNAVGSVTATTTVTVNQPPTISSFTATPSTINAGQNATLSWATTGATSLSISPGVGTVTGVNVSVSPTTTTTYTLTATNAVGSVTATTTVTVSSPEAWTSLSWANELPGNYNSDVYRWLDSGKQQRTAALTRNTARDPGGSYGGMLRQFRFYTGMSERVATGTGASSGTGYLWNGWGYVVSHFSGNGVSHSGNLAGTYRRVFVGRHHAIHEFSWNMPIGGTPVKVTVHWFFSTGRDHPVYAVTFDTSVAGSSGLSTEADSRTPYGDIAWDGDGTNSYVDGVKWGDKHRFFSRDEPLTAQSRWDYSQTNTVPYTMTYSRSADAEMGMVQTLDWVQHNTGGTWFNDNWGLTSENRANPGNFGSWMMPPNWNWPYQMCQYEMNDTSPTRSKRLAWGLMYGAVGKPSYYAYGYGSTLSGHPYQSYSLFMVMGQQSAGDVLAQATQVERMLKAQLGVVQGQVVTQGPLGVARSDSLTYPVPGYNSNYAAYELLADMTGHFNATLNAAGGEIQNPLFLVHTSAGVPARLYLDGVLLSADVDYFASFDASTGLLWLTLNRPWSGSHTLASGT